MSFMQKFSLAALHLAITLMAGLTTHSQLAIAKTNADDGYVVSYSDQETLNQEATLSGRQVQSLRNKGFSIDGFSVRPSTFFVRIASGVVNGTERTVVFLGETHFKTETGSKDMDAIVKQFDFFGVEGLDPDKYWGQAKAFEYLLAPIHKVMSFFTDDSTINSTYEKVDTDSESKSEKLSEVVELERNSEPGIQGNLAILLMPATVLISLTNDCARNACYRWPQFKILSRLRTVTGQLTRAILAYVALDIISRSFFGQDEWQDNVFILSTGIVYHRNEAMAESIIRSLQERPDRKNMLVVTGFLHTSGMMTLLKEKYGFREVRLR